ncbi:hypothetical protein [Larkinella sp. C7]|uniref:hypothetical protein n=1 Tax=Larkinella sp. C7 TaxID=2576607 RepID=UPI001111006C|nr:hypothetical protein [Larkinella sp. C7]
MNAKMSSLSFVDNLNIPSYITLDLINKYLANECTKEEKEVIDQWYNSYDTNPEGAPEADKNNKALRLKLFSNITKRLGKNFSENSTEYE